MDLRDVAAKPPDGEERARRLLCVALNETLEPVPATVPPVKVPEALDGRVKALLDALEGCLMFPTLKRVLDESGAMGAPEVGGEMPTGLLMRAALDTALRIMRQLAELDHGGRAGKHHMRLLRPPFHVPTYQATDATGVIEGGT